MSANDRKGTQRDRILTGMLNASLRHGYAGTNVSRTIEHAGVSRPTFYEYFTNKDDCFLAVQRENNKILLEFVRDRVTNAEPARAVQAGAGALFEFAESNPDAARFLMDEAPAAGPSALDQRERAIDEIEQTIEHTRAQAHPDAPTPDIPTHALLGGLFWLLAPLLRRGEPAISDLAGNIQAWIDNYQQPTRAHRWHTLEPGPQLPPSPHVSDLPRQAPRPLPPGRPRLSRTEVARNQRERILYATAIVAAELGYTAATVADIASAAALDRRVFYSHFPDKRQAFLALHEFALRHTLTIAAGAFFSASTWPERIWEGIRASCQFGASYPIVTRIAFVDSHAVGAPAIQQIEDSHAAFAIFLHEGYQHTVHPPPRPALQAIAATIFEIGHRQARHNNTQIMPRLVPHATYLALTPFLGATAANDFIDDKLRSLRPESS
jgi:AcrR family transcriptional regulator